MAFDLNRVIEKLDNGEFSETDWLTLVLEAVASSPRFGVLREKEGSKYFITRANMHALVVMPFGSGKTSSFIQIEDSVLAHDITFPGLIGTINKEGDLIESELLKATGKVLVIDEFQKIDEYTKNAMNSLLEYPHYYTRTLGFKLKGKVNKRGKFFRVRASGNRFEIYAKFSCIAGGMYVSRRTDVDKAWFSRFIPVVFVPSLDYYRKLSRGEKVIKINPAYFESDFVFDEYLSFNDAFWGAFEASPFKSYFLNHPGERGYLVRCLQDLARLSAFFASLDKRNVIKEQDWRLSLRFLNNFLLSYIKRDLDEIDFYIINNYPKINQVEVAKKFGVTQPAISERVAALRNSGLLKEEIASAIKSSSEG